MSATFARLAEIKARGFAPATLFDCGASDGGWTKAARALWPELSAVLIEPLDEHREALARIPNSLHIDRLLWGLSGQLLEFNEYGGQSSVFPNHAGLHYGAPSQRSTATLDRIAEQTGIYPDLVKMDIQGAELQAMMGASKVLSRCKLLVLETWVIAAQPGIPLMHIIAGYLAEHGWLLYEIGDLMPRDLDGALTAFDAFFVPADSPLIADKCWAEETVY